MKEICNFVSNESGNEYSVYLHIQKMGISGAEVMYITITTRDEVEDYTVILNGLPTVKNLKRACGRDAKAAELIIGALKEKAVDEARKYWDFQGGSDEWDEWTGNLDNVLEEYIAACG